MDVTKRILFQILTNARSFQASARVETVSTHLAVSSVSVHQGTTSMKRLASVKVRAEITVTLKILPLVIDTSCQSYTRVYVCCNQGNMHRYTQLL